MGTITLLVNAFAIVERPAGNLLEEPGLVAQAAAATRFVAGYAELSAHAGLDPVPDITGDTVLNTSEWALIRPLFMLYVERETALQLEASRGLGIDVFGRSTGEIANDIAQMEAELPRRAFYQPMIWV